MTQNDFIALCEEYSVHPAVALECEAVVAALKTGTVQDVRDALANNF